MFLAFSAGYGTHEIIIIKQNEKEQTIEKLANSKGGKRLIEGINKYYNKNYTMEKDIYKMKLHDKIILDNARLIMRVPGGWIYGFGNEKGTTDVFVPWDNEFQKKPQPELFSKEKKEKLTIEQRKEAFKIRLEEVNTEVMFKKEALDEFFSYWTEPNQTNTKMKFEMQKTWSFSRRLSTWAKRSNQFNNEESNNEQPTTTITGF
jgi:hypothetical protein